MNNGEKRGRERLRANDDRLRKKELDYGIRRNDGMVERESFTIYVLCFT